MKADFYITYHHGDEMAARWIAAELKQARFTTLSDSWDFLRGETPLEKIDSMFSVSRCVMVLISSQFIESLGDSIVETLRATSLRMTAVGAAAPGKKETEPLLVSPVTPDEILAKRKQEMEQLLESCIKHNSHMKLDLEQEKEKEVKVKDEITGKIEKRKQWVWEPIPLETVLKDGKNYILVNPSGMGKTTFLTYAACALLGRVFQFVSQPPPYTTRGTVEPPNFIVEYPAKFVTQCVTLL